MSRAYLAAALAPFLLLACGPEEPCADLECQGLAYCESSGDEAACVCEEGYALPDCTACAEGWQDHDGDGACRPGCAAAGLECGAHGTCSDASGTAACTCDVGWGGEGCAECGENYVPTGDGCEPAGDGLSCATARWLEPLDRKVTGTNVGASDRTSGSCQDNDDAERVYVFTTDAPTRVRFETSGYDTVLYLRTECGDPASELRCNDDGGSDYGSVVQTNLPAGTYYLFVDAYSGETGTYTLDYEINTDPCAGDPCPGDPACVADLEWRSYECTCPSDLVPWGDKCLPDPCTPNPCLDGVPHQTRCEPVYPADHTCSCASGWLDDGQGGCELDPNANEWTVMVFLNADNDLETYGFDDLAEMMVAGSTTYVNVIVLIDGYSRERGVARTLRVTKDGYEELIDHGEVDMGDWETLRDFGVWATTNYPARRYALFMWNHGEGWRFAPSSGQAPFKGFSNDENGNIAGISISNGDYARALEGITTSAGARLDLVGFDACLMGMYEVAHATAPYARYFLASSEVEPATGWAWDGFLPDLVADPFMSPDKLGVAIADAYKAASRMNSTLALSDLDALPAVDAALTAFADALLAAPALYGRIDTVRAQTQAFYESDHRDLQDFAARVAALSDAPEGLRAAAGTLVSRLQDTVVHNRVQSDYPGANGLAIYLPGRSGWVDGAYDDAGATWSSATTWDEFLYGFTGG